MLSSLYISNNIGITIFILLLIGSLNFLPLFPTTLSNLLCPVQIYRLTSL